MDGTPKPATPPDLWTLPAPQPIWDPQIRSHPPPSPQPHPPNRGRALGLMINGTKSAGSIDFRVSAPRGLSTPWGPSRTAPSPQISTTASPNTSGHNPDTPKPAGGTRTPKLGPCPCCFKVGGPHGHPGGFGCSGIPRAKGPTEPPWRDTGTPKQTLGPLDESPGTPKQILASQKWSWHLKTDPGISKQTRPPHTGL